MVKILYKYYGKLPKIAKSAINFSMSGVVSGMMIDYYNPEFENILIGCDDLINKK